MKNKELNFKERGKGRFNCQVKTRDIYYMYRKLCKKSDVKPVVAEKFSKMLKRRNELIFEKVVLESKEVKLSNKIGDLVMVKSPINFSNPPIDWGSTRKLWAEDKLAKKHKKLVRHVNEHTDNYIYRFKWFKTYAYCKNISVYRFILSTSLKERMAKLLKNNPNIDCYELKKYDDGKDS